MSPEQFLLVGNLFSEAALLLTGEGVIQAVNRAGERAGLAPADLVGRRLADVAATPAAQVESYLHACARSREPLMGALTLRDAAGRELPFRCDGALADRDPASGAAQLLVRLTPRKDALPQFAVLNQKIADLTEEIRRRQHLEKELWDQRESLRVTLSSIGDGVIVTDPRGTITFLNSVAAALTGWTPEEAEGRPLEEVFCIVEEATRRKAENPALRSLREGRIVGLANHTLLIAKDGAERAIDDSAAPIRANDGSLIGVVLVFRDVTETHRLTLARSRLAALVESSEDAIIGKQFDGVVTDWNKGAEQLFQFTAEETIGRPLYETIVPPELKEELLANLARVQQGDRIEHFETERLRKDGRRIPVSLRISPIRNDEGEIIGASAIERDIRQQKLAEQRRAARLAVTQILAFEDSADDAIPRILDAVCAALHWHVGAFWTVDEQEDVIRCREFRQAQAEPLAAFEAATRSAVFPRGQSLPGRVWATSQPCWIDDVSRDPIFQRMHEARQVGLHGAFALPVMAGEEFLGVIEFFSREVQEPDEDLLETLAALGVHLGHFLERRRAEHQLKLQARVLDSMIEGVSVTNDAGVILYTNPAEDRIFGYEPGELIGRRVTVQNAYPPEENERRVAEVIEQLRTQGSFQGEFLNRRKDGSHFVTFARITAVEMEDAVYWVCVQEDVTLQKQAHERLRESELRFRQLAENIQSVFWMSVPDKSEMLYVSPAYEQVWGRTCQSLYENSHSFVEAVYPDDRPRLQAMLEQQRQGQNPAVEYRIVHADGSLRWIWDRSFAIFDADGRVERVCGVAEDITRQKHTEAMLRFLADASASLASLVDLKSTLQKVARLAAPDFADWCRVDLVDAAGSLQTLAIAHVEPQRIELAERLAKHYPPNLHDPRGVGYVIREGKPEMMADISEEQLRATARDEEHFQLLRELGFKSYICAPLIALDRVLGAISFVSGASGRRYGPEDLAVAEDLAHRAAIAIENARLYQEVRDADRRKDEFLAMLAHELRNPLAPIRTGLDVLALQATGDPETIELMQQQVEHLVRLVDDLLDVSRIIRGRVDLRREPVELGTILHRAVEATRPIVEKNGHELIVSAPDRAIWLDADPVRLAQVFGNLLNNACKYTPHGGRIELTVRREGDAAEVAVRDNGIGIEPNLLHKVFDLFTQATRSLDRSQGGLGIGLTLVKNLVEMHGGSVAAHSEGAGQGSRFIVRLPVIEHQTQAPAPERRPALDAPRRILLVDDNVGAAQMLALLLANLGPHQVEIVHDGAGALALLPEFRPHLVLLDIGLPGMNGYQICQAIRKNPQYNGMLLVAVTGYGQEEDRRKSRAAGFDEHLVKPPSLENIEKLFLHPKLT